MTLADLIRKLDQLADDLSIYAAPHWRPSSGAAAVREPTDGSLPEVAAGLTYLTSVREAKRVIAERRATRPDRAATVEDRCGAVIYYAIYNETEPLASELSAEIVLPLAI